MPHAAVVNQLQWLRGEFGTGPTGAVLLKTPATIDHSGWGLLYAAPRGGGRGGGGRSAAPAPVAVQPNHVTAAAPKAVPRLPPTKYVTMYALL
ncbi:hypothetical protein [Nocardia neocaledoniensis]|uniref:hypothetical protein n=1 Tax=Nocardia neocaledoniensis TaxID=236511 RepID=UPI003CC804DA